MKSMTKRTEESEKSMKRRKILDAPPVCDIANNAVMMVYDHINTFYI